MYVTPLSYIHGGAWRDPRITLDTFEPIINKILKSKDEEAKCEIAAFASIDYRLSPHPEFPQDPATTPPERYRGAKHPDHLNDVRAALAFLQQRFGFGDRYMLLGHSAGGCLAYQLLMRPLNMLMLPPPKDEVEIELPKAIIGLEGIYDFTGLNKRVGGSYTEFLTAALGPPKDWDAAAPMKYGGNFRYRFQGVAVFAHSIDDELVDYAESEGMAERFKKDAGGKGQKLTNELRGTHDEVWQDGRGVAKLVINTMRSIRDAARTDEKYKRNS